MKIPFVEPSLPRGTEASHELQAPHPLSAPMEQREGHKLQQYCTFLSTEEPLNEANCLKKKKKKPRGGAGGKISQARALINFSGMS